MSEQAAPLPDQDARDLIVSRLDLNLLVEAGAGSGKTHSLAERMVAGVVSGRYQVHEMAAVTFTRKAAAELRGRFQLALERRLVAEQADVARARIREALAGLERLFAGTIHSFCAHLLRERPVEARLAPGFTELDEVEDVEIRRRAWRDFLARARAQESDDLRALTEAGIRPADLDASFDSVCTFEEVVFPPGTAGAPDPKPAWTALERFWRKLAAHLPDPIPNDTTCEVQQRAKQCRWLIRVARRDRPADLVRILAAWEKENLGFVLKHWHPQRAEQQRIRDAVADLIADFQAKVVQPFLAQWRRHLYRLAVPLLTGGRAFARDARLEALTLNYNDLLQRAAWLLGANVGVRRALQQKYRWLFVDEFQDTDPIQAEVILLLASGPDGGPSAGAGVYSPLAAEPGTVRLRPGSLFIVGDPKQSIYRFRRADIQIYNRVREIVERSGGKVVPLTATFRALPALGEWANDVFEPVFPPKTSECQPRFQPLRPVREAPGRKATGQSGVCILTVPSTLTKKDEAVAAEADRIARYIRSEIDSRRRSAGDFLILTWKKANLGQYAAALEDRQVPIEVSGAGAFMDSAEVATLAALLGVLADPDDGVALVGVLRGPLFGVTDEELFDHKSAGGWFSLAERAAGHPPVVEALGALREMHGLTRELPLPVAVERILEVTGFLALAAAGKPGGADAGDLLNAVNRLRHVMDAGGTLADAADALREAMDTVDVEAVPLEPGRRDVVRVMNLHKAKGLEAPVVFLADPGGGWTHEAELRIVRDGGQALGYFKIIEKNRDKPGRGRLIAEPAGWDDHAAAEQAFLDAEEDRLRYVAATRARDLLVVSRWEHGSAAIHPWSPFDPHLVNAEVRELDVPKAAAARKATKIDLSAETRARLAADRDARHGRLSVPSFAVESVTGATRPDVESREDERASLLGGPATGADWGDLIHKLLEFAMRQPTSSRADLKRLSRWLTVGNAALRPMVPEALDTVERVMASDVWRQASAAEECHVEVPFGVRRQDSAGRPVVVSGVLDLAFRTSEGWHVLDYKTDQIPTGDTRRLLARHERQLDGYAEAWGQIVSAPRPRTGLLAVRGAKTAWRGGGSGTE